MNKKEIKINNITISETSKPFIVAEAGVNYYDIATQKGIELLEAAKLMVEEAAKAGASAIKFQTYKAGKLASKFSPAYWDTTKEPTTSQYELFKKFDKFTEKDYQVLSDYSKEKDIVFMSTPFDKDAVEFLSDLMPVFKIASADITNTLLLKQIASKQKPIFLATGAASVKEIKEAVDILHNSGADQIVLMHCILNYPTKYENANLRMIKGIKKEFPDYLLGYSDHTFPDKNMMVLTYSYLLGARVIEKHFTLDKTIYGNDHFHSMDPVDIETLKANFQLIDKASGREEKEPLESEEISIKYARRSIVAEKDIPKGKEVSFSDLEIKRPGTGINPGKINEVVGKRAKRDIKED